MAPIYQNQAMSQTEARKAGRWLVLDKLGAVGAFLAAAAAPCCFPLLAAVGAALGLGAFQSLRGYMDYAIQAMAFCPFWVICSPTDNTASARRWPRVSLRPESSLLPITATTT